MSTSSTLSRLSNLIDQPKRKPSTTHTSELFPAYNGYTRKFYSGYHGYRIAHVCKTKLPGQYPIFFTFNQCKQMNGSICKGEKSFVRSTDSKKTPLFHLSQCEFSYEIHRLFTDLIEDIKTACVNKSTDLPLYEEETNPDNEDSRIQIEGSNTDEDLSDLFVEFILSSDIIMSKKQYEILPREILMKTYPFMCVDLTEFEAEEI